jgi:hypothetical protein
MINPSLLRDAAASALIELPERHPGYRDNLMQQLADLIRKRDSAAGAAARRQLCQDHVEALATSMLAASKGGAQ